MKISIIFILFFVITSSWCQDETVFHCSLKPSCQIAQCDPVTVGWNKPGFDIDEHLHDREFPITCKSKHAPQPQNTADWLPLVSRNILDIGTVKSELKQLEDNVDKNKKKLDKFEKSMLDRKSNNEIKKQPDEVRVKALQQSGQINDLVRRFAKQSIELNELKMENVKQFTEISDLKEDFIEIQEMNKKLIDDNSQMKKAIFRIEERLAAEKTQKLPNRPGKITRPTTKPRTTLKPTTRTRTTLRPTTKTRTTLKPTPAPENCKLKVGNICYFVAVIHNNYDVDYNKAVDICNERNADVGLIRDEGSYNAIVNYLRRNIPKERMWVAIWTGIHFDPMTRDVTPANSFTKWVPGFPYTGNDHKDLTNVYLVVHLKQSERLKGMMNEYPTRMRNGVICEILI